MAIEVYKSQDQKTAVRPPHKDIIKRVPYKEVKYQKDGTKIEKTIYREVNITRMVNESAKIIKEKTAAEKLAELEKLLSKETK